MIEEDHFEDGRLPYAGYMPGLKTLGCLGAASCGSTQQEALKNLPEAIELVIGNMMANGEDLPEGFKLSKEALVAVGNGGNRLLACASAHCGPP